MIYKIENPGFNLRLSDIHCALGISQLNKLSLFIKKNAIYKKKTATNYHKIYRNREFKIAIHVKNRYKTLFHHATDSPA